jgi:hypothetical protein
MNSEPKRLIDVLTNPAQLWGLLREYLGFDRWRQQAPIDNHEALKEFLNTRASYVAQFSLYGYLRTRAGMRYPELFEDDPFVKSINIAKWQMWLACLSDLAVFAGGRLMQHPRATPELVSSTIQQLVGDILDDTGVPPDAGKEFAAGAGLVRARLAGCNWRDVTDDEGPFSQSPAALVRWAPIVDDLKQLDEEIVTNSVRFRWQKVRSDLRKLLDAGAVLGFEPEPA